MTTSNLVLAVSCECKEMCKIYLINLSRRLPGAGGLVRTYPVVEKLECFTYIIDFRIIGLEKTKKNEHFKKSGSGWILKILVATDNENFSDHKIGFDPNFVPGQKSASGHF